MGYSRRKEARDIAQEIDDVNKALSGQTLGSACAAGLVTLNVSCYVCRRRGRYRLTRLIDQYGPSLPLPQLKEQLASNCPRKDGSYFNSCGTYFPDLRARPTLK